VLELFVIIKCTVPLDVSYKFCAEKQKKTLDDCVGRERELESKDEN
jgi:hypothetical protein